MERAISGVDPVEQRRQYVLAFNDTMVKIWKEQIVRLGIFDTGNLFNSIKIKATNFDGKISEVYLSWDFMEYGVYVERGTGRETPVGNPGDIGRPKIRQPQPWMAKKFYSSFMNIRDFFIDNLGREFCAAIPRILGSSNF